MVSSIFGMEILPLGKNFFTLEFLKLGGDKFKLTPLIWNFYQKASV